MPHDETGGIGEHTLAQRAKQGDRLAFDQLVHAHDQSILRLAHHLCDSKDDAQLMYKQVFLTAYKDLASFRFELSFRLWLYRILSRFLATYSKNKTPGNQSTSKHADTNYEQREKAKQHRDQECGHARRESVQRAEADRVRSALRNLDPSERVVFELRHYAGLLLQTIAEILQVSETTVTTTFCRAMRNLRRALAIGEALDQQRIVSFGLEPAGQDAIRKGAEIAKGARLQRK